jgi:ribA/ribD-fused uncharacterized protein
MNWRARWLLLVSIVVIGACRSKAPPATKPAAAATAPVAAKIDSFEGNYRFLSNFFPAEVEFEGIRYPTVEHAYQSAKTLDRAARERIAKLPTPGEAKKAGRAVKPQRADWETAKFTVMEECVRYKFTHHPELRAQLLATGDAYLEEGNTWNDQIWGVSNGIGENRLGKLLMQVRKEIRASSTTR